MGSTGRRCGLVNNPYSNSGPLLCWCLTPAGSLLVLRLIGWLLCEKIKQLSSLSRTPSLPIQLAARVFSYLGSALARSSGGTAEKPGCIEMESTSFSSRTMRSIRHGLKRSTQLTEVFSIKCTSTARGRGEEVLPGWPQGITYPSENTR